jgi:general secretion pathway protein L
MMEQDSPMWRQRLRDLAQRAGLPRFWRWWTTELALLIPAAPRSALQRWRMRPVLEFGEREVVLWRPQLEGGVVKLTRAGTVSLIGDAQTVATAGSATVAALVRGKGRGPLRQPKVVVALPPKQVLRRELSLPAAVEENLHQMLAFDLDRLTPFRPEQMYFDAVVVGRDARRKMLTVDWVAALKTVVDGARRQVEGWGAHVVSVVPGPVVAGAPRFNLVPGAERPLALNLRRWQVWAPTAIVVVLALGATLVPLVQKRDYAIELGREADTARQQALVADGLRDQLTRQQDDYNHVLAKKFAYPSTVQVLDDVTRILPDDTWLTQFDLKTTVRGKDLQRDLLLRGESGNAGKLISLLEDSKLVEQAAARSPTTKIQAGAGEVFDLGAQLRPVPLPLMAALSPEVAPVAQAPQPAPAPVAKQSAAAAVAAAPESTAATTTPSATPATAPVAAAAPAATPALQPPSDQATQGERIIGQRFLNRRAQLQQQQQQQQQPQPQVQPQPPQPVVAPAPPAYGDAETDDSGEAAEGDPAQPPQPQPAQ